MKQWWEDLNEELQKGTPFVIFTTWVLLLIVAIQMLLAKGVR